MAFSLFIPVKLTIDPPFGWNICCSSDITSLGAEFFNLKRPICCRAIWSISKKATAFLAVFLSSAVPAINITSFALLGGIDIVFEIRGVINCVICFTEICRRGIASIPCPRRSCKLVNCFTLFPIIGMGIISNKSPDMRRDRLFNFNTDCNMAYICSLVSGRAVFSVTLPLIFGGNTYVCFRRSPKIIFIAWSILTSSNSRES